jgi:hypothetical protein
MIKVKNCCKLVLVASLLVSSGCASHKIANLDEFKPTALEKSKFAPSEEQLKAGKTRIVVFALDNNGNIVAEQANLGLSLAGNIEAVLTEANTAELVDRKIASKIQEEIKLAEMSQTGAYEGPVVADYAIAGSLNNAGFSHKFFEATRSVDKKTGKVYVTAPSFRYTAKIDGIIKVYAIPSMKVVKTFTISDNKARSEDTRSSNNYVERDDELVRGAGKDAIGSIKMDIKNELAQQAYITDKKVKDTTAVFKVNLGSQNGAKPGAKCEIFAIYESINQLTGKTETERRKVCEGTISDQITQNSSWIVASVEESQKVRLGDQVKVVYEKGSFEYLKDAGSMMNTFIAK